MVKNNLLLSVLFASFTAPVLASWVPKECPLGQTGKFIGAVAAVDVASSRFTRLPRAIEFHGAEQSNTAFLQQQANALVAGDVTSIPAVKLALETEAKAQAVAPKSAVQSVLDTSVSVDLTTVGVDGGVTFKLIPLAAKAVATYALIQLTDRVIAAVRK